LEETKFKEFCPRNYDAKILNSMEVIIFAQVTIAYLTV
jgi:hypothetical protein